MSDSFLAIPVFNQLQDSDQSVLCGSQTPIILPTFDLMSESDLQRINNNSSDETPRTSGHFSWTEDDNNNNDNDINPENCRPKRKRNLMKFLEPSPKRRKLGKQKTVEVNSQNTETNLKVKTNKKVTVKKSSLKNQPLNKPTDTVRMTRSRSRKNAEAMK